MTGSDDAEDPGEHAAVAELLQRAAAMLPAGGEERPGQLAMAEAVSRAVGRRRHLVVQAGTGTGKSLAYLVPLAGGRVKAVVATATKALQDQLARNDLPLVARALGRPFEFAVLKGRSNYLCRQRVEELDERGFQQQLPDDEATTDGEEDTAASADPGRLSEQVARLLRWAGTTATGDRADLPFEPNAQAWAMVSVGPRECPGAFRCPAGARCFAEAARSAAAAADVVVVNTHLYGAHLASGGSVLPEHDVVVFDEAHELEAVMTASLGVELSPGRLRALTALARPVLPDDEATEPLGDLADAGDRLQRALEPRLGTRVLRDDPPAPDDQLLGDLLDLAAARLDRVVALLRRGEQGALPGFGAEPAETGRKARALSWAGHLADDLARLAARSADEVAWVDGTTRAPVLRLSPIDVGPALAATLWGEATAVLTSATIPPGVVEQLGLDGFDVDQLDVGSPFDYRSRSLLYVARHLPDRRLPDAEPALLEELEALIAAAGGRTLALFTSRRATEAAAEALRERLPYRLLVQGELPKARLLATFAEDESSCLFATLGFWQGVDVPGRALSLVTLDRLPFARPDDPLLDARRERAGPAAFRTVDLPRAATLLAQGAGRLIRSADDSGVVAVLDPRLATAGYRPVLLAALPPMRRTTDRRQVEDFLHRTLATPAGFSEGSG